MLGRRTLTLLLAGAGLAAAAAGCGQPEHAGSVRALATAGGAGWHQDYRPLQSPAEAVRRADLIVAGSLVGVGEGIAVDYPGERDTNYATYRVRVDRVIAGRGAEAGTVIHVVMRKGVEVTTERLSRLNPEARTVLVLADRTTWKPRPEATVTRPASIPAGAPLYAPFSDGIWLQGPADGQMYGLGADAAELPAGWTAARTVDEYAARLTASAGGGW